VCVSRRFDLSVTADAPAQARHLAHTELAEVLAPGPAAAEAVADVELLVSELVSNAVKTGAAPVTLGLDIHHDWLGLSVHDRDPGWPVMLDPDPADTHGRGLRIVQALTEAWGVEPASDGGKTVWVRVPLPGPAVRLDCTHRAAR